MDPLQPCTPRGRDPGPARALIPIRTATVLRREFDYCTVSPTWYCDGWSPVDIVPLIAAVSTTAHPVCHRRYSPPLLDTSFLLPVGASKMLPCKPQHPNGSESCMLMTTPSDAIQSMAISSNPYQQRAKLSYLQSAINTNESSTRLCPAP
jgi:hypothetical protein